MTEWSCCPTCPVHGPASPALAATSTQPADASVSRCRVSLGEKEIDPPKKEEEKNGSGNDNSKENPSSPVVPTSLTVVLVSELIDAAVESRQSSGPRCVQVIG